MMKEVKGIGWLRGGIYQNVGVEGLIFSVNDVVVKKLTVSGVLSGKKIKIEDTMAVEGVARGDIHFTGGNHFGRICGVVTIQKQEDDRIILEGEGEIHAKTIVMDTFNIKGRCHISRLEADKVYILEPDSKKNNRNDASVVDEIICKKLKVYELTAEKVIADEVELYGECKIGTLIYKEKKLVSPKCIIQNENQIIS